MLRNVCCSLITVCVAAMSSHAQTVAGGVAAKGMDMETSQSGMGVVQEVDFSEKRIEGHPYLFDEYQPCTLYADGKEYKVEINYDLQKSRYEVKEGDKLKIVASSTVEKFVDPYGATYQPFKKFIMADGIPREGIVKQSTDNAICNLLTHYRFSIRESNYVAAMDVGEKNASMRRKEDYYLLIHGTAYKVHSSRKKMVGSLPFNVDLQKDISEYIKSNALNLKTQAGAFALAQYINTK